MRDWGMGFWDGFGGFGDPRFLRLVDSEVHVLGGYRVLLSQYMASGTDMDIPIIKMLLNVTIIVHH
jgi:hypothetical protein